MKMLFLICINTYDDVTYLEICEFTQKNWKNINMLRKKHLFVNKNPHSIQYPLRAVIWLKIAEMTLKNSHNQESV